MLRLWSTRTDLRKYDDRIFRLYFLQWNFVSEPFLASTVVVQIGAKFDIAILLIFVFAISRRGLNPPQRVKSISMTSFTQQEIEFLQGAGNEVSTC